MVLLIDNYDSFSYNVYQLLGSMEQDIKVIRNDEISWQEAADLKPAAIVLSPGPGRPAEAGICIEVIRQLGDKIPVLGICLGHQAICEAYGAEVTYAKQLMHGKQSEICLDTDSALFGGMHGTILAARYHSLAAKADTIPKCLKVTAKTYDGEVMAVEHKKYAVFGVQFHPESILTPEGSRIVRNFLTESKKEARI